MEEIQKLPKEPDKHDKCTTKNLKSKILLYISTKKSTAIEINQMFHTGDARKYVSLLRRDGFPIADYRLPNCNTKVYFIHQIQTP